MLKYIESSKGPNGKGSMNVGDRKARIWNLASYAPYHLSRQIS